MPSVKIPRKSTFVDMTPFVDVAFLILTFFIMATKFKPEEPVEIKTPNSVSTRDLPEDDAIQVTFDSTGRVFFSVLSEKDPKIKYDVIKHVNDTRSLGLTDAEMKNFVRTPSVGVPFSGLKQLLAIPQEDQKNFKQPGIPLDTLGGELYYWIRDAVGTFSGKKLLFLIKGDNSAKYPAFKQVLNAFKKNEIFKFQMITMLEDAPAGSELAILRNREKAASK
ncbi:MAG TPA: biopolymer transporter ExbD [Chitinophagaceae bacterium]|jgi:biopolymer transport protein ExbD|nr:biopolymer transporter ExbD [Chitinophagaceae bacterium]